MSPEDMEKKRIFATEYRIRGVRDLKAEFRGNDTWAITNIGTCLNRDGHWEYEPRPSNRTDEFLKRTRFTLNEALEKLATMTPY